MADEMQEIEARLAAYVDGTLPADQRAEIEAYLKANANHGRLISELKSIKSAVSSLPKEKAPAEVLDGLQAHLERHQLLEGVEETVGASRIQRWPQFGALAAVLMLAAGLGVLVYAVLPRQKGPPPELAMLPDVLSTQPSGSDEVPAGGASLNDLGVAAKRAEFARDDQSNGAAARSAPVQSQQYQTYQNGVNVDQQAANAPAPAIMDMAKADAPKLTAAAPSPQQVLAGPTRVLTVTTDDPILTANLIAGYFSQANLSFQRVASVDSVLPGRSGDTAFRLADAAARNQSVSTTLPDVTTLTEAAEPQRTAADNLSVPLPSEVVVLRQLSTQQLADAETALRAQRMSRQRTDADWVGQVTESKTESATQPATQPAGSVAMAANEPSASSQPSLNPTAGSGTSIGGSAAVPSASSQPAADSAAVSNLVIVVVAGEVKLSNTTQPATAPSGVVSPALTPATLPTTQP